MGEKKVIDGVEILWDTAHGKMASVGRDLAAFWLDPSLLSMLAPLRAELGTELFALLVAHGTSRGAKEDYETMVTVFADTFEEGFLAWGRAVGVVGWGRFELPVLDRYAGPPPSSSDPRGSSSCKSGSSTSGAARSCAAS